MEQYWEVQAGQYEPKSSQIYLAVFFRDSEQLSLISCNLCLL